MQYTYQNREYIQIKNITYASKLEARWGYFFDFYNIPFRYSSTDPLVDFEVNYSGNLRLQVKPGSFSRDFAELHSKYPNCILVFGQPCYPDFRIAIPNGDQVTFDVITTTNCCNVLTICPFSEKGQKDLVDLWSRSCEAFDFDPDVKRLQRQNMEKKESCAFLKYLNKE